MVLSGDDRLRGLRSRLKRSIAWPAARAFFRLVPPSVWLAPLRARTRLGRRLAPDRYTDADPCRLRWVDPAAIEFDLLPDGPQLPAWGRVEDGRWDRTDDRFAERPVPRAIEAHYRDGVPWRETPLPAVVREQIERFGDAWGHTGARALERRIKAIERLYDRLSASGYRTQTDLLEEDTPGPPPVPVLGEITVEIGHDGRLCWRRNGQHRLAIARVLGIERVPVVVARRHADWQRIRDRLKRDEPGSIPRQFRSHPDLVDLIPDRADHSQ